MEKLQAMRWSKMKDRLLISLYDNCFGVDKMSYIQIAGLIIAIGLEDDFNISEYDKEILFTSSKENIYRILYELTIKGCRILIS